MYTKIESSKDLSFSFNTEFKALKDTITGLTIAYEKSRISYLFASIDVRISWDFDFRNPVTTTLIASSLHDLKSALVLGAGGAMANLIPRIGVSSSPGKLAKTKNPLAYSYLISENFGFSETQLSLSSEEFLKG